jgi:cold shock CspA family protein
MPEAVQLPAAVAGAEMPAAAQPAVQMPLDLNAQPALQAQPTMQAQQGIESQLTMQPALQAQPSMPAMQTQPSMQPTLQAQPTAQVLPFATSPGAAFAAPALPLPAGWIEYFDSNSNKPYYHNAGTGQTTWERPLFTGMESALGMQTATPAFGMPAVGFSPAMASMVASPLGMASGVMASGSVKTWYDDKGFGFIVPQDGGQDIFVHRSSLVDGNMLERGSTVMYEPIWHPDKNKYAAMKVTGAVPGGSTSPGAGGVGGCGAGGTAPGGMANGAPTKQGTVKTWYEDKGFGFLISETGEEVFVHRSQLVDGNVLTPGNKVMFDLQHNPQKAKPNAVNVTGATHISNKGDGKGAAESRSSPYGMDPRLFSSIPQI